MKEIFFSLICRNIKFINWFCNVQYLSGKDKSQFYLFFFFFFLFVVEEKDERQYRITWLDEKGTEKNVSNIYRKWDVDKMYCMSYSLHCYFVLVDRTWIQDLNFINLIFKFFNIKLVIFLSYKFSYNFNKFLYINFFLISKFMDLIELISSNTTFALVRTDPLWLQKQQMDFRRQY